MALGLGETAIDLGHVQVAEKSLRLAQNVFPEYLNLLSVNNTPESAEDRHRKQRLGNAFCRLQWKLAAGAIAGVGMIRLSEPSQDDEGHASGTCPEGCP